MARLGRRALLIAAIIYVAWLAFGPGKTQPAAPAPAPVPPPPETAAPAPAPAPAPGWLGPRRDTNDNEGAPEPQGTPDAAPDCPPARHLGPYPAAVLARLAAFDVAAGDPPLLPLAVASFPRSGTTWMRAVLSRALGWAETSVDASSALGLADAFLVKTHFPDPLGAWESAAPDKARGWGMFARAVHLVRNPFDAIASAMAFEDAWEELAAQKLPAEEVASKLRLLSRPDAPGRPKINGTSRRFKLHLSAYERHLRYWSRPPPLPSGLDRRLLVRYEDLATDPQAAFLRIAEFVFDPRLRGAAEAFLSNDLNGNASAWPSALDHPFFPAAGIDPRALFSRYHSPRQADLLSAPSTAQSLLLSDPAPLSPPDSLLATAVRCAVGADAKGEIDTARRGKGARKAGDAVGLYEQSAVKAVVGIVGREFLCQNGYGGAVQQAGFGEVLRCGAG
ncbi:P-loop containing nucleoside triphosphate hydrolase protein [Hyaloraphidium curvatum]|nr:P-loop containing nucleoside triphosphate hydrolase protein [Hyaloraphidium curvatum]